MASTWPYADVPLRNYFTHSLTCTVIRTLFTRVLAIAILSVRSSVRPSVTRVDQSKTVQARITKSSQAAARKTSFKNRKAFL